MMKHLRFSFKALFMLTILLFGCINGWAQNRFETRISESAGDAEEQGPTGDNPGEIYLISAINMVYDTTGVKYRGQQTVGLRFTDIDIPLDALILNAYIQFDSWAPATDSTSLYIWTEDVADAPPIVETDYNISSRVKTAESVPWIDVPAWSNYGLHGPDQQTPELTSIIQPIVDKTGWMAGNSMCFIIQGSGLRLATSWDLNPNNAPKLVVDFGAKISETVCDSYTSPSGKIWTTSGSYFDTIPNSFGGDSIILVDLTVLESTTSMITETVCDSYTSPSGKTWTVSGTFQDTIPNAAGCDSVITVDLKVNASSASSITETVCDSYTSPGGKFWTSSGSYLDTIPNAAGCDSIITIDLTVNQTYTGEINDTICSGESYSFGGKEITETGQYTDSLTSISGCDSIVVLNLLVHTIDTSVTVNDNVLTANETDAAYQWLKDDNLIDGETAQGYTVTETGSYAVVITKNDCVDTSGVYNIQIVTGLSDISFGSGISVYPNPTKGSFTLDMGTEYETLSLRLYSISGKLISVNEYKACREIEYQIDGAKGVYFLQVSSGKGEQARIKIMKE
jgi:hypothetical protein